MIIWLNKEDHFEMSYCSGKGTNIRESVIKIFSILDKLDKELNFAFD